MKKIVEFFINNPKFNHTLFVLTFLAGLWSYSQMAKELFPETESDIAYISGSYVGSSIDTLNKIVVNDLESDILGLEEVKELNTEISPGNFRILATLKDGVNKREVLDDIEASIKRARINLPSDMNDPTTFIMKLTRPILYLALGSKTASKKELVDKAEEIKNEIVSISGVGGVDVYGNNQSIIEFVLNEKKIQAFGLDINSVYNAISSLSYTFPLGQMKDTSNGYYYLTMTAGDKTREGFENTLLKISGKEVMLKEIAQVNETFKEESTKAYMNGKNSIIMTINQLSSANAIELVEKLYEKIEKINSSQNVYQLTPYNDRSIPIKKRLNTVFSNIMFGMILVILALYLLINRNLSIVIGLGIPTSFVLAFIFAYQAGMSINLVSLLGLLIALGIVVDDAIVVGENIQRHIEMGKEKAQAAIDGVMEVWGAITMATLTTLFAFLPMLMISGQMGKFIMLIPIMVSVLLVASLIEVFVFLPIHAEHMLHKEDKVLSWSKINKQYEKILEKCIKYKKTFLTTFFIAVPFLTIVILKSSSFQMFPAFDTTEFKIAGKYPDNYSLEKTIKDLKVVNNYLSENKERFSIVSYTIMTGQRNTVSGAVERGENMFSIDIELEERSPQNIFEEYIDPLFALADIKPGKRDKNSKEIASIVYKEINNITKDKKIVEMDIIERKVGPVKVDIQLSISSPEREKIVLAINKIGQELKKINGVKNISNDMALGIPELKLKINRYGEELGFTEKSLGAILSGLYLENRRFNIFTSEEMLEVNFVSAYEDKLDYFKSKEIDLPGGKRVLLSEIVEFEKIDNFLKMVKIDGEMTKNVYGNVNAKVITATEVVDKLAPIMEELRKEGVKIIARGENQSKEELANDMKKAVALALALITLSMLYMFKDFIYVFVVVSVIPFSVIGALAGHLIMDINLTMPSMIGILGLAGVVINDAILMLSFLQKSKNVNDFMDLAKTRFRPIMLTSITTLLGLFTLIFFATGQAKILQPIAISLGYGLAWGTVINLLYVPVLYALINKYKK